jgi:hemerythrin-like metal-binding protein
MNTTLRGLLPEEMLTDHLGMDMQHEEIFSRIEYLRNVGVEEDRRDGCLTETLSALLAYIATHFSMEEQLAAEAGLEFSIHAQEHARNLQLLNKALGEVAQGSMAPRQFLRYIDYWFEHHINEFDRPFAQCLQVRSGSTHKMTESTLPHLPA